MMRWRVIVLYKADSIQHLGLFNLQLLLILYLIGCNELAAEHLIDQNGNVDQPPVGDDRKRLIIVKDLLPVSEEICIVD